MTRKLTPSEKEKVEEYLFKLIEAAKSMERDLEDDYLSNLKIWEVDKQYSKLLKLMRETTESKEEIAEAFFSN